MRHFVSVSLALCALLALAVPAYAAKVDFNGTNATLNPDDWATLYGNTDDIRTDWSTGNVGNDPAYTSTNPAYVEDFTYATTGGGGGGGGGTGGGGEGGHATAGDLRYDMTLNDGKDFGFTALFYHSTYGADNGLNPGDVALRVRLLGTNDLDDDWHEISVADLEHGIFLTWDVIVYDDDDNKTITLDVDFVAGDGTYAAGFFLDDVIDAGNAPIPEPATVGLVVFGLAGVFVRRKNR